MKNLSSEQLILFGIPESCKHLVEIADSKTRENEPEPYLVLVRVKKNYREHWINSFIKQDPTLKESPERLRYLEQADCPVDMYDSGIIYHIIRTPEYCKAVIVCRTDDYPKQYIVDEKLVDKLFTNEIYQPSEPASKSYEILKSSNSNDDINDLSSSQINMATAMINSQLSVSPSPYQSSPSPDNITIDQNCDLREWIEGTVVRVFTLEAYGNHPAETHIGTRGKIDCFNSKCVQTKECPTVREMFEEAIAPYNINRSSIEVPGICFAFIVINKWNQLRKPLPEKPNIVLFRTYSFVRNDYFEIDDPDMQREIGIEIPVQLPKLTVEQARNIIKNGGVVITNKEYKNIKYMTDTTAREYNWLQRLSNPAMTYYDLKSKSIEDANRFKSILNGWMLEFLEEAIASHDVSVAEAIDYILDRHLLYLRAPGGEASLEQNQGISQIMAAVRRAHFIAKKEFEQQNPGKKFVWGGSHDGNIINCREVIRKELTDLENKNGLLFFNILNKCRKFKADETYKINKVKQEKEQEQKFKWSDSPFPDEPLEPEVPVAKAQNPKKAVKNPKKSAKSFNKSSKTGPKTAPKTAPKKPQKKLAYQKP